MEIVYICSMNTALISIGSNEDTERNITLCRELLNSIFSNILYSETSVTKPFGDHYKHDFLNQLALAKTEKDKIEVEQMLKLFEKQMGRDLEDKEKGVVKIDIDLIKWNDTILKKEDWQRSYVADLLPSLLDAPTSL